jgi:hypothetical protein
VVRRVPDAPGQTDCHILYVGRSGTTKSSDVLRALNGAPVLTVTDERQGVDGGVIHFVVRDGKVRFGINPASAQARGLTISSKLLGLAVPVRPVGG